MLAASPARLGGAAFLFYSLRSGLPVSVGDVSALGQWIFLVSVRTRRESVGNWCAMFLHARGTGACLRKLFDMSIIGMSLGIKLTRKSLHDRI